MSDFDKDDEEENIESNETPKAEDEDESEDGFVVPDGYLSENEVLRKLFFLPNDLCHQIVCLRKISVCV